jgi:hypothetical protein
MASHASERGARGNPPLSAAGAAAQHPVTLHAPIDLIAHHSVWTVVALLGIVLLIARRWALLGPYPPGLDGAQWLAIGRGLLHGTGRSTGGAYAPVVPLLAAVIEPAAGPLLATRILAVASLLVLSLVVWFVARALLGAGWGCAAAAIVLPASALAEPALYGGYPQQFALAAGIIALWASIRYLDTGATRSLWLAGFAAVIAAATHHIYALIAAASIGVTTLLWLSSPGGRPRWPPVWRLALALTPAALIGSAVALAFVLAGYVAPLSASAQAPLAAWRYTTRESPWLWLGILSAGLVSLLISWRARVHPAWIFSVSLIAPAALLVLISGQPRLLPPVMIGAGIAATFGARTLASTDGIPRKIALVAVITSALLLVVPADRAVADFARFYQVADRSLAQAAAAIADDGGAGTVAVRQDHRGWPVGWWFEALLEQPIIVGSGRQWLGFPDEWDHARQADALFDGSLDAMQFREQANAAGGRYLVIPKWDWIGWDRWMQMPGFPIAVLYDDDEYLVLRVA